MKFPVVLLILLQAAIAICSTISASGNVVTPEGIETVSYGAVERFQEYLRIKSVQPDPDYNEVGVFLQKQADRIGLPMQRIEIVAGKPIFVMTWAGKDASAPSVMLNSHMDVVPVEADKWLHDPFSAHKTENGDIYARGSQDMKCVGMQHLEAIEQLIQSGFKPTRTILVSFVPDEEIGGHTGMEVFVKHATFKQLNIGFVLDEGLANPTAKFMLYNGERAPWWVKFTATGQPGHGSMLLDNTAPVKMSRIIGKAMEFRESQVREMELFNKPIGEVTTINWTFMKGGHSSDEGKKISVNVIPSVVESAFDIRIPPAANLTALKAMLDQWANMDEGVSYEFIQYTASNQATELSASNPYWVAFKKATDELGLELEITTFPAATDSRYVRAAGLPALGFSPMNFTPVLLHQHNEYLNERIFLKGIGIYQKIISKLSEA